MQTAPHPVFRSSVLAALVHDTLKSGDEFDSLTDLIEAVKRRAAKLHVPYDADAISEALGAVARTRRLPIVGAPITRPQLVPDRPAPVDPVPVEVLQQDRATRSSNLQRLRQMMRDAFKGKIRRWSRGSSPMTPEHIEEFRQREGLTGGRTRPAHVAPLPLSTVSSEDDDEANQ